MINIDGNNLNLQVDSLNQQPNLKERNINISRSVYTRFNIKKKKEDVTDDKRVHCIRYFVRKYGYAIRDLHFSIFLTRANLYLYVSRDPRLYRRAAQIIFVRYLGLQLRERHLGFLLLLLSRSQLSLPFPPRTSSLTVEELRGFKFAPRRANATRN